jgi:hypothetical protein
VKGDTSVKDVLLHVDLRIESGKPAHDSTRVQLLAADVDEQSMSTR